MTGAQGFKSDNRVCAASTAFHQLSDLGQVTSLLHAKGALSALCRRSIH